MTAADDRLLISGPRGALQAVIEEAAAGDPGVRDAAGGRYAVLCHPHPLFGGTMDNKVVTTLTRAMHELGIPTIRFNFRGVGASEGVFDAGAGETADALSVAAWGAARWPGRELVVCGFSFGAYVAFNLAQRVSVAHLVTIAPPVAMFDFSGIEAPQCPWLVVQGDADDVVDPRSVIDWVGSLSQAGALRPPPRLVVMPAVGHFFHGRLVELRDAVIDAVRGG
jgi:alpha/beta superfamily hydrolase